MTTISQRRKGATYGKSSHRVYPSDEFIRSRGPDLPWTIARQHGTDAKRLETDRTPDVYEFDFLSEDEISLNQRRPNQASTNQSPKSPSSPQRLDSPARFTAHRAKAKIAATKARVPGGQRDPLSAVSDVSGRKKAAARNIDGSIAAPTSPESEEPHRNTGASGLANGQSRRQSYRQREKTPSRAERPAVLATTPDKLRNHQKLPVTPPSSGNTAYASCVTPRQREIWQNLLTPGPRGESAGDLSISELRISGAQECSNGPRRIPSSNGPIQHGKPARKRRLIDLLNPDGYGPLLSGSENLEESELYTGQVGLNGDASLIPSKRKRSPGDSTDDHDSTGIICDGHVPGSPPAATLTSRSKAISSRGARVTYAQQRSYLSENAIAIDSDLDMTAPNSTHGRMSNACQESLVTPVYQQLTDEFDIPEDDNAQSTVMKSARELRNAGGNARLLGELELLLEEMTESMRSSPRLRSPLIRLVTRLKDPSTVRLFADKGFDLRFMDQVQSHLDAINASLIAMVISQLLTHNSSAVVISRLSEQSILSFLIQLLQDSRDLKQIPSHRNSYMTKSARQAFQQLCDTSLKTIAGYSPRPTHLSSRILGLHCIRLVAIWRRDNGGSLLPLDGSHVRSLILTSIPDQRAISEAHSDELFSLGHAMFILAATTLNSPQLEGVLLEQDVLDRLCGVLRCLPFQGYKLRALIFELYIDLTQASPRLCAAFAKIELLSPMIQKVTSYFASLNANMSHTEPDDINHAILALMCLINIVESSDMAREALMVGDEGPTIEPKHLHTLVENFKASGIRVAEVYSVEEATRNVPLGYLAVMMGFICLNRKAREFVQAQLTGQSLESLLEVIREFTKHYQTIEKTGKDNRQGDGQPRFADRIQTLLAQLDM